jgi:hypothetical protein
MVLPSVFLIAILAQLLLLLCYLADEKAWDVHIHGAVAPNHISITFSDSHSRTDAKSWHDLSRCRMDASIRKRFCSSFGTRPPQGQPDEDFSWNASCLTM